MTNEGHNSKGEWWSLCGWGELFLFVGWGKARKRRRIGGPRWGGQMSSKVNSVGRKVMGKRYEVAGEGGWFITAGSKGKRAFGAKKN